MCETNAKAIDVEGVAEPGKPLFVPSEDGNLAEEGASGAMDVALTIDLDRDLFGSIRTFAKEINTPLADALVGLIESGLILAQKRLALEAFDMNGCRNS